MASAASPIATSAVTSPCDRPKTDVVFTSAPGYSSCAHASSVVPSTTPVQVFEALTREDVPPAMRFVQERTKYKLVSADDNKRIYEAEYKTNCRVAGGYQWQGTMPFHITHDRRSHAVIMRLAKPGFLQRLELSFAMAPLDDGSTALTVSQKIKPSLPTWDPVSKHIVKAINKGLLLETLADTMVHVEKCKSLPPPPARPLTLRTPSWSSGLADVTSNLHANFQDLGKQLSSFPILMNDDKE